MDEARSSSHVQGRTYLLRLDKTKDTSLSAFPSRFARIFTGASIVQSLRSRVAPYKPVMELVLVLTRMVSACRVWISIIRKLDSLICKELYLGYDLSNIRHHIDLIERYGSGQVSEVMLVLRQVCTQLLDLERHGFACAGREAHINVHLERFGLEISPQPPSRLCHHRV